MAHKSTKTLSQSENEINVLDQSKDLDLYIKCTTYNHEKYIESALKGFIIQQTKYKFVVVIVDDASTDNTQSIIKQYEDKYPEIIKAVYLKENHYSIKKPKYPYFKSYEKRARYVAYCEGDDYWTDPLKLQKQIDFLENNPEYSLSCHNALVVYDQSKKIPRLFNKTSLKMPISIGDILNDWIIPTQSIVLKTSILSEYIAFKKVYNGDLLLSLLAAHSGKIHYINEVMSVYRKNKRSLSATIGQEKEFLKDKLFFLFDEFNKYSESAYNHQINNAKAKYLKKINERESLKKSKIKYVITHPNIILNPVLSRIHISVLKYILKGFKNK